MEVRRIGALQRERIQGLEVIEVTKDGVGGGRAGGVHPVRGKEGKHGPVAEIPERIRMGLAVEDDVEVHLVRS